MSCRKSSPGTGSSRYTRSSSSRTPGVLSHRIKLDYDVHPGRGQMEQFITGFLRAVRYKYTVV